MTSQLKRNTFKVECDFIIGSKAKGCFVVLGGKRDNITFTVYRNNPCSIFQYSFNMTNKLEDYQDHDEVFGYDIETDGTVGTLRVPGNLLWLSTIDSWEMCPENNSNFSEFTTNNYSDKVYVCA